MLHNPSARLMQGLAKLELEVSSHCLKQLLDYLALMSQWNRVHNLTAIKDIHQMVTLHLLDSLSVFRACQGKRTLDIGTGAGLPGLPLAMVCPDTSFTLVDSTQKKVNFVKHVVLSLKLDNVVVVASRIEDYQNELKFERIISRAFSSLRQFVNLSQHLIAPEGRWLAMKGRQDNQEQMELESPFFIEKIERLDVPGLEAERHLIWMGR